MSRNKEYVGPSGLRLDGRRPHEARRLSVEFGTVAAADGSCTVTCGGTRVTASVLGPRESGGASRAGARQGEGSIACEVAIAAFAGQHRRAAQRRTRVAEEAAAAVLQVARSLVLLRQYPNAEIRVYVEVQQLDGSEKVASVNAACLALADASVAMRGVGVCTDAGLIDGRVLVDLTAEELRSQCPTVTLAAVGHDTTRIAWLECAARISPESLAQLVEGAQKSAAAEFEQVLKKALEEHAMEVYREQN